LGEIKVPHLFVLDVNDIRRVPLIEVDVHKQEETPALEAHVDEL
jgi:hypothetical protein